MTLETLECGYKNRSNHHTYYHLRGSKKEHIAMRIYDDGRRIDVIDYDNGYTVEREPPTPKCPPTQSEIESARYCKEIQDRYPLRRSR